MKIRYLALAFLVSSAAYAAEEPLLTKSSGGGFAPPEYQRSENCRVFADRVEIGAVYGIIRTEEVRQVKVSDTVLAAIEKAALEKMTETDNGLCDAPATYVTAGETVLFSSGGCGSPRRERQGPYTHALRQLLDAYCPMTFDYQP